MTSEFSIWKEGVPVVTIAGSPEFSLWSEGVPLSDVGGALGGVVVFGITYRDLSIFDLRPHYDGVAAGQMDDLELSGAGFGLATPWRASGAVRRTVKLPLVVQGFETIAYLRKFWDVHRSRQVPFWLPSWVNDFGLVADASSGAASITVEGHMMSTKHALGAQYRFIALLTRAGKLECYGVTAATPAGANDTLVLSRVLESDLEAATTICCPLLLVRPIEDLLEFDYLSGNVIKAVIETVECPREYPAAAESSSGTTTAHFGTRPVFLYRISDGSTTLTLADYGVDVEAAAITWQAADVTGDDITSSLDMLGDTLRVTLKTDDSAHPLLDYLDPLQCRNYTVEVWMADLDDLAAVNLATPDHVGRVEEVSFGEQGSITLEVSSLFRFGEQRIPKVQMQRLANESVYKYATEATFTTAGTISGLSSDPAYVEAAVFGTKATAEGDPNWFALGKVVAGTEIRMCTGQSGNRLYLNYPLRRAVVGGGISAVAGDDKRVNTWAAKFGQLTKFLGFPYIPARNPQFQALETPKQGGGKKG